MLVLDSTSKSITVVMSGAAATTNPTYVTAYADNTGTSFIEGSSDGALNGTTPVTIIASPAASTRRLVNSIYIENTDTAAVTLTISFVNGANTRTLAKVTLQVGDTWTTTGAYDTNGNLKQIIGTVNLATQVTGILGVTNGGTGTTTSTGTGSVVLNNTPTLTTPAVTNPTITNYVETLYAPAANTSFSINLANGTVQEFTLNGNGTITLPASVAGKSFTVIVTYSGSYTLTWSSTSTLKWASGTTPTPTSANGKYDIFNFLCDGTNIYGSVFGQNY
jgi:hypothetical protein